MSLNEVAKGAIEGYIGRPLFQGEEEFFQRHDLPTYRYETPVKVVDHESEYYGREFLTGKALYCYPFHCWTYEMEPGIYVSERDLSEKEEKPNG